MEKEKQQADFQKDDQFICSSEVADNIMTRMNIAILGILLLVAGALVAGPLAEYLESNVLIVIGCILSLVGGVLFYGCAFF